MALGIAFVNTLLMFYRERHAPVNNQPAPPSNHMAYGAGSLPPFWGQTPNSPFPYRLDHHDQGMEFKKMRNMPMEGEDILEEPSRRRRLTERDDIVKIQ